MAGTAPRRSWLCPGLKSVAPDDLYVQLFAPRTGLTPAEIMTEHLVGFSRWKEGDGLVHHAIGDYFPYRYMAGVDETKVETWKTWTLQGPSGPITARHIALAFHETQSVANPLLADNGGFMTVEDPRAPGSLMVCSPWDPGNVVKSVTKYGPPVLEALLQNYHWSLRVSGIAYCSPAKCERLCAKVDQ